MDTSIPYWLRGSATADGYRSFLLDASPNPRELDSWDYLRFRYPELGLEEAIDAHFEAACHEQSVWKWVKSIAEASVSRVPLKITRKVRTIYSSLDEESRYTALFSSMQVDGEILVARLATKNWRRDEVRRAIVQSMIAEPFGDSHSELLLFQYRLRVLDLLGITMATYMISLLMRTDRLLLSDTSGQLSPEAFVAFSRAYPGQICQAEFPLDNETQSSCDIQPAAVDRTVADLVETPQFRTVQAESVLQEPSPSSMEQLSNTVGTRTTSSQLVSPTPSRSSAMVVVRKSGILALQNFIDESSQGRLTVDARFLASGLSVHEQWYLALGRGVRFKIGTAVATVLAAKVTVHEDELLVSFRTVESVPGESNVSIALRHSQLIGAKTWEAAASALFAYLFARTDRLQTTTTRIDAQVAAMRFKRHQWSVTYLCADTVSIKDVKRVIQVHSTSRKTRLRKAHDTRSYFQIRQGNLVAVRGYRTGRK